MATAFTQNIESSSLLRFPLSYRLVLSDPPGLRLARSGHRRGQLVAARNRYRHRSRRPSPLPWATIVLLTFALVNLVLARMLFAWLERWLAQRRTREIMGILFFLFILSFQLIGPLVAIYEHRSIAETKILGQKLSNAQRPLPPGLAAAAIAGSDRRGKSRPACSPFLLLVFMELRFSGF